MASKDDQQTEVRVIKIPQVTHPVITDVIRYCLGRIVNI